MCKGLYSIKSFSALLFLKNIDEARPGRDIIEYKAFSDLRFLLTSFRLPELKPT